MLKNKIYSLFGSRVIINIAWLLVALALIYISHSDHSLNPDEGVILNGAWNLYNGQHLYKDFFEFISPASFYLIFGIWKIFGVSFAAAKIASMIILFVGVVGLYLTTALFKKKYTWIVPLAFLIISSWWCIINHNIFNLVCLIWTTYFILKGLNNRQKNSFIGAGFLTGLAILFLQQKGLAFAAAVVTFLIFWGWKNKQKIYLKFAGFFSLATILPVLALLFWPLHIVYYSLFLYPAKTYGPANKSPFGLLILYFVILLAISVLVKGFKEKSKKIWFLIWLQFWLLLTTCVLPDTFHISVIIFPSLILLFYLAGKFIDNHLSVKMFFLAPLFVLALSYFINLIMMRHINPGALFHDNRFAVAILNNCPGQYLYSGPFAPNLYFETRKFNATPYSLLISTQQTPFQFNDALKNLIKNNPSCAVLFNPNNFFRFQHDKNNVVERYIRANYNLIYNSGDQLFIYRH